LETHSDTTKSNRHKDQHKKVWLGTWNKPVVMRVVKHWRRLPR